MNLKSIKQIAFDHMREKRSHPGKEKGNKFFHGERVATLVIELRKIILPDDDSHDEILAASAWFHDIMNGEENHAEKGAGLASELLFAYCSAEELDKISFLIKEHDNRPYKSNLENPYLKLLQDADLLDKYGISDIWINFLHHSSNGNAIIHVLEYFENEHLLDIAADRSLLNYDISKKIFDEKCEFLKDFIKRLKYEGVGRIYKPENFL